MRRFLHSSPLYSPDRIRGFVFDLAMLAGNILFIGTVTDPIEDMPERTVAIWLGLAVITQLFGALLKAGPLRYRLSQNTAERASLWLDRLMDLLILFHFILFTVTSLITLGLLGLYDPASSFDVWIAGSILFAGLLAFIVWRAGNRPGQPETSPGRYPVIRETLADASLWVSVTILTRFYWDRWYIEIEPSRGIGLSVEGIVLLAALSFLFLFFYLPSRYLYLVEDRRYGKTWLRMWSAMLPLAWFILVG